MITSTKYLYPMITLGLLLVIIKTGRTVAKTKCPPATRQVVHDPGETRSHGWKGAHASRDMLVWIETSWFRLASSGGPLVLPGLGLNVCSQLRPDLVIPMQSRSQTWRTRDLHLMQQYPDEYFKQTKNTEACARCTVLVLSFNWDETFPLCPESPGSRLWRELARGKTGEKRVFRSLSAARPLAGHGEIKFLHFADLWRWQRIFGDRGNGSLETVATDLWRETNRRRIGEWQERQYLLRAAATIYWTAATEISEIHKELQFLQIWHWKERNPSELSDRGTGLGNEAVGVGGGGLGLIDSDWLNPSAHLLVIIIIVKSSSSSSWQYWFMSRIEP